MDPIGGEGESARETKSNGKRGDEKGSEGERDVN